MTKNWAGVERYNSAFFECTGNVVDNVDQNSCLLVDGGDLEVSVGPLFVVKRNSPAETASNAVINSRFPYCFTRRFLLPQRVITRVLGETPMNKTFSSMFVRLLK